MPWNKVVEFADQLACQTALQSAAQAGILHHSKRELLYRGLGYLLHAVWRIAVGTTACRAPEISRNRPSLLATDLISVLPN